jgi:hypothetical protein
MKTRIFSPIVIVLGLAILVVLFLVFNRTAEEKVVSKVIATNTKLKNIIEKNSSKNKPENSPQELLTSERIYTEDEIKNTTEVQFIEMLKTTEAKLPYLSDLKQVPSQALHHIPALVLEAGRNLGAIKEVIKFHPEYEEKTIPLYSNCAQAENRPTPVRALCLTNLIEISKKHNLALDLKKFPTNVVELAKLVTDI